MKNKYNEIAAFYSIHATFLDKIFTFDLTAFTK